MHVWFIVSMKIALYNILVVRIVCDSIGYYCTGSNNGNLHLKCVAIPCNGTLCETIIDYVDENGPDVTMDSHNKLLLNFKSENISIIHVIFINNVRVLTHSYNTTLRLIKPIVLKVQLAAPGELYKLNFINYVNGGPTEEVISKHTKEYYFGCNSGEIHPTCGLQYYGLRDPVPFSEGFCCSCLDSVNAARQPRSSSGNLNRKLTKISIMDKNNDFKMIRGEPDCKNLTASPGYANAFTYHESSHCFRYSDLWFNVYKVEEAQKFVPLTVEFFKKTKNNIYVRQKRSTTSMKRPVDGKGMNSKGSAFFWSKVKGMNETISNNLTTKFILIPQDVPTSYREGLPNLDGIHIETPGKFLVISPNWISKNGTECDKIGVQPQAFYEQSERCYRPRGSCLDQQPIHFLRKSKNKSERLFVEDYVQGKIRFDEVAEQIIVDRRIFPFTAVDDDVSVEGVAEIKLDDNGLINNKILLQISEIHAILDDDSKTTVKVRVFVTNLGLRSTEFFIDIFHRGSQEFRQKSTVDPQQTTQINLGLMCHTDDCNAVVRLYHPEADCDDRDLEHVVYRKFGVVRGCRCYCLWHRRCKCYHTQQLSRPFIYGGCHGQTLSQTEYNEAGFLGDVPPETAAAAVTDRDRDTVANSFVVLIMYLATAVLLGLLKALSPYRSHWLWMVSSDWLSELSTYKEPELQPYALVRDNRGYYVHPYTKSRNIRLFNRGQEFVNNVLFFVILPTTMYRYYTTSSDYSTRYVEPPGCAPPGLTRPITPRKPICSKISYWTESTTTSRSL